MELSVSKFTVGFWLSVGVQMLHHSQQAFWAWTYAQEARNRQLTL